MTTAPPSPHRRKRPIRATFVTRDGLDVWRMDGDTSEVVDAVEFARYANNTAGIQVPQRPVTVDASVTDRKAA